MSQRIMERFAKICGFSSSSESSEARLARHTPKRRVPLPNHETNWCESHVNEDHAGQSQIQSLNEILTVMINEQ